jgi:hypothetical protein
MDANKVWRVSLFPRATLPHPSAPQRFAAWQRKRNGLLQGARATVGVGQNPYRNPTATFLAAPTRQACSPLGACSIVAHQRRNVRRRVQEGVPSLSCEFGSPELILMARYCQRPEGLLHCRPFGSVGGNGVVGKPILGYGSEHCFVFGFWAFWLCLTHCLCCCLFPNQPNHE